MIARMKLALLLLLSSTTMVQAIGFANGVKIGETTDTSVVLWTRLTQEAEASNRVDKWDPETPHWRVPGAEGEVSFIWWREAVVDKRRTKGLGQGFQGSPGVSNASESTNSLAAELASSEVDTVDVSYIKNKGSMIAQGSLIRGVLETAIQSDLPGFIRAEVSHDVYSFDGSNLLIPKASRLVGNYRSGLVRGQTRVFVVWDRLLRPDGASILIGSPGTDLLGRAGLEGDLDTHFFKIFGSSILLSLVDGAIDVSVENARDSDGSGTTILQNTNQLNRAAEIALENSINIPPTIHVDQGTPIQVFVARDLDFRNVAPR